MYLCQQFNLRLFNILSFDFSTKIGFFQKGIDFVSCKRRISNT